MNKISRLLLSGLMVTALVACDRYTVQYDWESHRNENQDDETDPQGDPVQKTFNVSLAKGAFSAGDEVSVDFDTGEIVDLTTGGRFAAEPFPPFMQELIKAGGLAAYLRSRK